MTKDEIKNRYSMREIAQRYGYQINRAGFISCPFHQGDRHASMKIYPDSYYCFGCGAGGDVFSFVQRMEQCDFKTAFYSLGGTYKKPTFSSRLTEYRQGKKIRERKRQEERILEKKALNSQLIDIYRDYMQKAEPFSDVWCDCCNALQYQLYVQEELNEKR